MKINQIELIKLGTKKVEKTQTKEEFIKQYIKKNKRVKRAILMDIVGDSGHSGRIFRKLERMGIIKQANCECGRAVYLEWID